MREEIEEILNEDRLAHVHNMLAARSLYHRISTRSETYGHLLGHLHGVLVCAASASLLISHQTATNKLVFASSMVWACHKALMGLAATMAREEEERESLLRKLVNNTEKLVSITPSVTETLKTT